MFVSSVLGAAPDPAVNIQLVGVSYNVVIRLEGYPYSDRSISSKQFALNAHNLTT